MVPQSQLSEVCWTSEVLECGFQGECDLTLHLRPESGAMSDSASPKPPRRPRYGGTHPRQFHEKYKEHQPQRYANDIAKIVASGKTPAGMHRSVLLREVLAVLRLQPGQFVADATLGFGGHAKELLLAVQPGGRLFGVDVDAVELLKTEARLRALDVPSDALVTKRSNFAGLAKWLGEVAPEGVHAVLADLGCSSMQLDDPHRGFSYKLDGPLDMRMNPNRGHSAAELLSKWDDIQLAHILRENADERHATTIARAILNAHHERPLTTRSLAELIKSLLPKLPHAVGDDPDATLPRVFQALRIAVNDEYAALESFLASIPYVIRPGGRMAVISFHSGEDRRVKHAFKQGLADGIYAAISEELVTPGAAERRDNPRSKSAKLRWAVRAS